MGISGNPESTGPNEVSGWVSPKEPTSGRRRLLVGGLVLAAILFVGYVGLIFLGGQVLKALRGTVEFGTGGSGCIVQGRSTTFPQGTDLYVVAHVSRDVALGEPVTMQVTQDGQDFGSIPAQSDRAVAAGECLFSPVSSEAMTPAHYRFEYLAGTETIAAGEFDIAP